MLSIVKPCGGGADGVGGAEPQHEVSVPLPAIISTRAEAT